MAELREYPRIRRRLTVAFELVRWDERDLDRVHHPTVMTSYDISASGLRLQGPAPIKPRDLKRLMRGVRKIRMAVYLNEADPPLLTFARLIWTDDIAATEPAVLRLLRARRRRAAQGLVQLGFSFISVRGPVFDTLLKYVNDCLDEEGPSE
jgi:hypothetical protein